VAVPGTCCWSGGRDRGVRRGRGGGGSCKAGGSPVSGNADGQEGGTGGEEEGGISCKTAHVQCGVGEVGAKHDRTW
jgi:hypothetical protein